MPDHLGDDMRKVEFNILIQKQEINDDHHKNQIHISMALKIDPKLLQCRREI